jgi:hypothetical protein
MTFSCLLFCFVFTVISLAQCFTLNSTPARASHFLSVCAPILSPIFLLGFPVARVQGNAGQRDLISCPVSWSVSYCLVIGSLSCAGAARVRRSISTVDFRFRV